VRGQGRGGTPIYIPGYAAGGEAHSLQPSPNYFDLVVFRVSRKRAYVQMKLEELLDTLDIDTELLMPRLDPEGRLVQLNCDPSDPAPFPAYLPLDLFDNTEYDCRLPREWLDMGWVASERLRKPVPGLALLPTSDELHQRTYLTV